MFESRLMCHAVALTLGLAGVLSSLPSHAQLNGRMSDRLENPPSQNSIQTIDSIVAVVNTDVITRRELDQKLKVVINQLSKQNVPLPSRSQLEKQVLERMITDKAQIQLAKESAIRIDDSSVEKTIQRIAEQNRMSLSEFRKRLDQDGISFNNFRDEVREEMLLTRVREREVDARLQISESEIDNFIEETRSQVGIKDAQTLINLAQILIRTPENASPAALEEARKKAEQLLEELKGGADFAKLSAVNSSAPEALKGGELGAKPINRLPDIFVAATQNLSVGQMTIVKSANGFHIIKLLERSKNEASNLPPVVQTRARHILIRPSDILPPAEAKRRLELLRERIVNKTADFAEMAKQFSADGSAAKGGDLGWLYQGDTVPEFEQAMNTLALNQISDVVESQFGFHIIQVINRKNESPSVERQRQAAKNALRERKSDEAFQDWIRQLRDRTYVEVRLDNI